MHLLPLLWSLGILAFLAFVVRRQYREHVRNIPLRDEIEAGVCFEMTLDRVRVLGTSGLADGQWLPVMKNLPKRLVVSTDAFMVSSPFLEYVFRGCESSIAFSRAPSRGASRDWIVITGQKGDRQVQVAVTKKDGLQQIWQALARTGAAPGPPFG